ncbi:hypothetical protein D6817_00275, partial [Candidatus Pacearchaeota archaeon]
MLIEEKTHSDQTWEDFNRWKVLPQSWKDDVDRSLHNVLASNRSLIERVRLAVERISEISPERFSSELESAWMHHNNFYRTMHYFLRSLPLDSHPSASQTREIERLLSDMAYVDTITLIYSLAIKKILSRSQNAVQPFRSFYFEYLLDHCKLSEGQLDAKDVLRKYHANSHELFEQRKKKGVLKAVFEEGLGRDKLEQLQQARESLFLETFYHHYLGKPERHKALVRISTIDNFDEYVYLYNLEGVEGFALREYAVAKGLIESKQDGLDYFYAPRVRVRASNPNKSPHVNKQIASYSQTTHETCVATSLMVGLAILYGEKVSREREMELYKKMRSEHLPGVPFSKAAARLTTLYPSLELVLIHDNPEFFDESGVARIAGEAGKRAVGEYREWAKKAKERKARILVANPSKMVDEMYKLLERGGVCMVATSLGGNVLHSELALGFSDDRLRIYDPLAGETRALSKGELEKKMRTPIGSW